MKASLYQLRSALASKDATMLFPQPELNRRCRESTSELKEPLRNPVGSLGAGLVFCSESNAKSITTLPILIIKTLWWIIARRPIPPLKMSIMRFRLSNIAKGNTHNSAPRQPLKPFMRASTANGAIGIQNWIDALKENRESAEAVLLENRYKPTHRPSDTFIVLAAAISPRLWQRITHCCKSITAFENKTAINSGFVFI